MDWPSIIGRVGSGAAVRLGAALGGLYLAGELWAEVAPTFHAIAKALGN